MLGLEPTDIPSGPDKWVERGERGLPHWWIVVQYSDQPHSCTAVIHTAGAPANVTHPSALQELLQDLVYAEECGRLISPPCWKTGRYCSGRLRTPPKEVTLRVGLSALIVPCSVTGSPRSPISRNLSDRTGVCA